MGIQDTIHLSESMKQFEEAHKATAKLLQQKMDWSDATDDEWNQLFDGLEQDVSGLQVLLSQFEELQLHT